MKYSITTLKTHLLRLSMVCLCSTTIINAGTLNISEVPLALGAQTSPAIFFTLDDSGSMDSDITTVPYWTAYAYDHRYQVTTGNSGGQSFDEYSWSTANNFNAPAGDEDVSGYWMAYGSAANASGFANVVDGRQMYFYLNSVDDNVDAYAGANVCSDWANFNDPIVGNGILVSAGSANQCSGVAANDPFTYDWRGRSFDLNVTYYNPSSDYAPWKGDCHASGSTACENATFTSARNNPHYNDSGYSSNTDLTGFIYEIAIDDKGFGTDLRPMRGSSNNMSNGANGYVDLWDSHYRVTMVNASTVSVQLYTATTAEPRTAASGSAATLSGTACYDILGDSTAVAIAVGGSINSTGAAGCKTIAEAQQNIANWHTYNRKRSYVTKSAIGTVVENYPGYRYGLTVINGSDSLFETVNPNSTGDFTAFNNGVLEALYGYDWPDQGTPLRSALARTGNYFDDNLSVGGTDLADPITSECQANHNILFTDGYYNGASTWATDTDSDGITAGTLGDIARHYYLNDLSPLPDNLIPTATDPAVHQHMVTHGISFGVFGDLQDIDSDDRPNPGTPPVVNRWLNESGQEVDSTGIVNASTGGWGDASTDSMKIDDLWHAAYNSKGLFKSAKNPSELEKAIEDAIGQAGAQSGTLAAPAQSSSRVRDGSAIYIGSFDSVLWNGDLQAYLVSDGDGNKGSGTTSNPLCLDSSSVPYPAGQLCQQSWSAADQVSAQATRRIITTRDDTGLGVTFAFGNLSAAQQTDLTNANVVSWLRGDASNEFSNSGTFRDRGLGASRNILGDIIGSSPVRVAQPPFVYKFDDYTSFRTTWKDRTPLIYVGANDGMLHAFNAATGDEVFAYIPTVVYPRLEELSDQNYNHKFTVNGSPNYGDVFDNRAGVDKWRTVLVGTAAQGGQGVYALDITNPDDATQTTYPRLDQAETATNPDNIALWEFTDADDADLGNVIGKPKLVKLNNGDWAAVFGNGYNNTNTTDDANVSATGTAAIFVVNAVTGALITKFDTMKGTASDPSGNARPNGIGELALIDIDGDSDADYIYAGDIFGNLWKVNITDNDPVNWGFSHPDGSGNPAAFFTATNGSDIRAITTDPILIRHPEKFNEALIFFGTGKMFEVGDNLVAGADDQAVFGIRDKFDDANYGPVAYSSLVGQTITKQVIEDVTLRRFREVSNNSVDYLATTAADNGWRLDLRFGTNNLGERVTAKPQVIGSLLVITSNLPSANVCEPNGTSYIYGLDALTGGRLSKPVFNVNNIGNSENVVDDADRVSYTDAGGPSTLIPTAVGYDSLLSGATVVYGDDLAQLYLGTQVDEGDTATPNCGGATGVACDQVDLDPGLLGRQSWRQIK